MGPWGALQGIPGPCMGGPVGPKGIPERVYYLPLITLCAEVLHVVRSLSQVISSVVISSVEEKKKVREPWLLRQMLLGGGSRGPIGDTLPLWLGDSGGRTTRLY